MARPRSIIKTDQANIPKASPRPNSVVTAATKKTQASTPGNISGGSLIKGSPSRKNFSDFAAYGKALQEYKKTGSFLKGDTATPTKPDITSTNNIAPTGTTPPTGTKADITPTGVTQTSTTPTGQVTPTDTGVTPTEPTTTATSDPFQDALARFRGATKESETTKQLKETLIDKLANPTDFIDRYDKLKEESGLDEMQSLIQAGSQQAKDIEEQLKNLKPQLAEATQDVDLTQSQLERRVDKESEPIRDQLVSILDDVATISEDYRLQTEDLRFRLGLEQQQGAQQLVNLEKAIDLAGLPQEEKDLARELFRFDLEKIAKEEQREITRQDAAKVNAKILSNLALAKKIDVNDPNFPFQMAELETQAGLPIGTFAALAEDQGENDWKVEKIFDSYQRDGKNYNDILIFDGETGRSKIKTVERVGDPFGITGASELSADVQAIVDFSGSLDDLEQTMELANIPENEQRAAVLAFTQKTGGDAAIPQDVQTRLSRANAGQSKQTRESNTESIQNAIQTGDPQIIEDAIIEVERKKFLPRTTPITKQFNVDIKDYKSIRNKFDQMQTAFDQYISEGKGNATFVDQALISLFNKITDPTSVVRESEFNRTGDSLGIPDRIQGMIKKQIDGGAGLTDETRQSALDIAEALMLGSGNQLEVAKSIAENQSQAAGIPESFLYNSLGLNQKGEFPGTEVTKQQGIDFEASDFQSYQQKFAGLTEQQFTSYLASPDFDPVEFKQITGRDLKVKASAEGATPEGNNKAPLPPPPTAQRTVKLDNGVPISEGRDFVSILVRDGSRMGREFLQCGSFVNMLAGGALWISDTIKKKKAKIKKIGGNIPEVGSIAVFDRGNNWGHVSLVERIFNLRGKPTVQIVESNNNSDGKVGRRLLSWDGQNWLDQDGKKESLEGFSQSFKKLPSQRRLARIS